MAWLRDVGLWALARLIVAGLFHNLEIVRPDGFPHRLREDRPRLVVANHLNGFVDVVVLVVALGKYPRYLARADLYRRWPLRWLMRAVGAIPVYQRGDVRADNGSTFAEVHRALAHDRVVAIFPEGHVSDTEQLMPLRTGAARMVFGALEAGVEDVEIIPVGITYVDKVTTRSRALVQIGEPISAGEWLADTGHTASEENRSAVRALTDHLQDALTGISPDYGSLAAEARCFRVADLVLRTDIPDPYADPPLSATFALARTICHLPSELQDGVFDRVGRYHLDLAALELRDDQVAPPARLRDLVRNFVVTAARLAIVLPLAFVGLATNLLPILIVIAVGTSIREPVTKGTARILTALVVFPAAWGFALWTSGRTGWQLTLWALVLAAGSVLLVIAVGSMIEAVDAGLGWRRVRSRRAQVAQLVEQRAETVDYVRAVLG